MTDDERVYKTLRDLTGLPGAKYSFAYGHVPPLPWFVYLPEKKGEVFADNDYYLTVPRYRAELYIKENDPEIVDGFAEAVRSLGPYRHREVWLDSENCMMHSYTFSLTKEGA